MFILTILSFFAVPAYATDPDVNCSAPASRLYDKKNSNDAIETTLIYQV